MGYEIKQTDLSSGTTTHDFSISFDEKESSIITGFTYWKVGYGEDDSHNVGDIGVQISNPPPGSQPAIIKMTNILSSDSHKISTYYCQQQLAAIAITGDTANNSNEGVPFLQSASCNDGDPADLTANKPSKYVIGAFISEFEFSYSNADHQFANMMALLEDQTGTGDSLVSTKVSGYLKDNDNDKTDSNTFVVSGFSLPNTSNTKSDTSFLVINKPYYDSDSANWFKVEDIPEGWQLDSAVAFITGFNIVFTDHGDDLDDHQITYVAVGLGSGAFDSESGDYTTYDGVHVDPSQNIIYYGDPTAQAANFTGPNHQYSNSRYSTLDVCYVVKLVKADAS